MLTSKICPNRGYLFQTNDCNKCQRNFYISQFVKPIVLPKRCRDSYLRKKIKILQLEEINAFIDKAGNRQLLATKVRLFIKFIEFFFVNTYK